MPDLAGVAVSFGPKPYPVHVLADPPAGVPAHARDTAARLPFELVEQHVVVHAIVVHRVLVVQLRERGRAILVGDRRNGSRIVRW